MGSLRFRLFRFPVEIQPGFWLLALIIGIRPGRPFTDALVWLAVILLSVLVHELGHAFAARAYGQSPSIILHMLGGLTSWSATHDIGKKRRILVTLAGPGAGFGLALLAGGALLVGLFALGKQPTDAARPEWVQMLRLLAFANVFWSVINLLPVLPFDGGQVLATALGPERRKLAATVSLIFGLITAFVLFRLGSLLGAALFALGGVTNFLAAWSDRGRSRLPAEASDKILAEARRSLEEGDAVKAATLAGAVYESAEDPTARLAAAELIAWSALAVGNVAAARDALREMPPPRDAYLEAAVAEADGDLERAARLLAAARAEGDRRPEIPAMLVRVLLRTGRAAEAAELALEIADQASDDELRRVADEAAAAGAFDAADKLRKKIMDRSFGAGPAPSST